MFCRSESGTGTNPKIYDMNEVTVLDKDKTNLAFVKRYGVQIQCVTLAEKKGVV
ncbi:hypothetical protein C5S35_14280 [Candidatus Methanophagaceae archaeon]|nr:hypothetical protein C5S35_14280 [Methanophagales archaeon]